MTEYEKDLNDLKEQIFEEGNVLVTKRALLERFCKIDEEYNGEPWNLLQILANINILIGAESCEDAVSRSSVFEIMGNLMSIPYDLDRPINKKDVSDSMGEIRALPPVIPTRKEGMQGSVLDKMKAEIREWYWQADKQALAKDPCVVDAMVDLFIRTINKYKAGSEK